MNTISAIRKTLEEVRAYTLRLLAPIDEADFCRQIHPDFSPLGWHLGHIGVTEAYWILQQCKGEASLSAAYDVFFSPTDNPKPNRVNLPPREEILDYLLTVRERVLSFLAHADFAADHPLLQEANIFHMLIQHEEQHNETMLLIVRLFAAERYDTGIQKKSYSGLREGQSAGEEAEMILVPAGPFLMGSNHRSTTLDNERPQHVVEVGDYLIDRYPVTNQEFLQFVMAGGYDSPQWWNAEGWQWRERQQIQHPLYWRQQATGGWGEIGMEALSPLALEQPVMCISWYEADAYARFIGKRLPTETEWEKAAAYAVLAKIGCVWEWTTTWFQPYPGFVAHPYQGYSVPYFDNQHRVLRGGSWATRPHVRRRTFRNWYHSWVQEIFAGFRCAQDVNAVTV